MNLSTNIINAVQLIERNQNYIFSNQKDFFKDFNIENSWRLTDAAFHGAYLDITYLDMQDHTRKMQIPIFDYQSWRAHHEDMH